MDSITFSSITTKGGDEGKTSLINGERRFKAEPIFDVLGTIDELSSFIGVAKAHLSEAVTTSPDFAPLIVQLTSIQKDLVKLGGQIASPPPQKPMVYLESQALETLESWQLVYIEGLVLKSFIQPGASVITSHLDVARTVCRRAERLLVQWIRDSHALDMEYPQRYMNRLSDFLFVCARWVARIQGIDEFV